MFTVLRIARSTVRVRWASFVGTFVALALGVGLLSTATLVIAATGHLAEQPYRYADAPAVVLPDAEVVVHDAAAGDQQVKAADQPGLTPALVTAVGRSGRVVADRAFYAQVLGGPRDQVGHGWSAAAFGGYRLAAGQAPQGADQIVLGGGEPDLVGQRVRVLTAAGPIEETVSGVTAAVPFEHAVFFADERAAQLSPAVNALVAYGPEAAVRQAAAGAAVQVVTGAQRAQADPNRAGELGQLDNVTTPLGLAAAVATLVAGFVVAGSFAFSITQRRRELAMLRLAGATRAQVVGIVGIEALLCVSAGVLIGLVASALSVGGSWAALCRLAGPIPLGTELLGGPWLVVAELGLLCALVALAAAVAPASLALRTKRRTEAGRG